MKPRHLLIAFVLTLLTLSFGALTRAPLAAPAWRPDPRLAAPWHWPTQADVQRLELVVGHPPPEIISILGHPCQVRQQGEWEEWNYPWYCWCSVWIKNGVAAFVYYTAGY